MNDPSLALRTAYQSALSSLTNVAGGAVSVYDLVPPDAASVYVYYSGYTATQWDDKDSYGQNVVIALTLVATFESDYGGQKELDNLANQITPIIIAKSGNQVSHLTVSGYTIAVSTLESTMTLPVTLTERGKTFSRVLRFRHLLYES